MRLPIPHRLRDRRRRSRGQSMVELALILPVLLLLVLFALDLGRLFLGYVSLQNMARVGATYAASNSDAWGAAPDAARQSTYAALMTANASAINCTLVPTTPPPPTFGLTKDVGDPVTVDISCDFRVITPGIQAIVGSDVRISSSSTFAIQQGCLADCPAGPPVQPPPPPDNCRTVPAMQGLSVAGARMKWTAAGFTGQFNPTSGDDTRTVATQSVTPPVNADICELGKSMFSSSVTVTLEDLVPPPTITCIHVPNMKGMTVVMARDAWTAAGFLGGFVPSDRDTQIVIDQITDPASSPGDCLEPPASVAVSYGSPPPPPPPVPCEVPNFARTSTSDAPASWTQAGFSGAITYQPNGGRPWTIEAQSLVGGTFISCTSGITLYRNANQAP